MERLGRDSGKQYQRKKELLPKHYISEADIDTAAAQVSQDSAVLQQVTAELNQHTIVAPFTGRVGIREVDIGKYIQAGEPIVNLESLTPAYIDFKIPEKWAHQVKVGTKVTLTSDDLATF